jgi:hypothetical protein
VTAPLRRAGRAPLDGDRTLLWTAAEGARGRRWRASVVEGDSVGVSILLEVGSNDRPSRLEVTTAAGLLTLHPDRSGSRLHGNVATADGVRHVDLPWSDAHHLDVAGCPVTLAVIANALRAEVPAGASIDVPVVTVGRSLVPTEAVARLDRTSDRSWHLEIDGRSLEVAVDADGLPDPADGVDWPLER